MITPSNVQSAFAHRGVPLSRVAAAPDLCDSSGCTSLEIWGGDSAKAVYFHPLRGKDFMVIVFRTPADARQIAKFERTHADGVATVAKKSALLVYLRSSERIAQLRAALTAVR